MQAPQHPTQTRRRHPTAGLAALLLLCSLSAHAGPAPHAHANAPAPTLQACDPAANTNAASPEPPWTVLQPLAPPAAAVAAEALWLNERLLRWGGVQAAAPGTRFRLLHSASAALQAAPGAVAQGVDEALTLQPHSGAVNPEDSRATQWFPQGLHLAVPPQALPRLKALHRGQLLLVQEDAQGRVLQATRVQHARALDRLYAAAAQEPQLGATVAAANKAKTGKATRFKLWAPTAQRVWLCLHADGVAAAHALHPLALQAHTGIWQLQVPRNLQGHTYTYLVDVFVPGLGLVRNRVTDPYALSLNTDSRRTWIGRLDTPALQPAGWGKNRPGGSPAYPRSRPALAATDLVLYELHVRDFSLSDPRVPPEQRGKYTAFTQRQSLGMQHLRRLQAAGLTDVHLLPVFDIASIPEAGCTTVTPRPGLPPDSPEQQAAVMAQAGADCFNWGYDPFHFTAPEGSYASNASDGAVRILEFRQMVQALHDAGLRVGMDVVYNHTPASGQATTSVLDRIVPGYYQRLNARGEVETSTCCANTATENRMMAKLMIDSAVVWARDHHIDSFRFDLMGHQPRSVMLELQRAVNRAAGRHIHLIGEGWNFGEVKDGVRFVQASQRGLNDNSDNSSSNNIGTFSDRARDAARGGGCCDDPQQTVQRQGWLNGLVTDPNGSRPEPAAREELLQAADLVRVGLAGTLAAYEMTTYRGERRALRDIEYAGQPAGYALQPGDVVNYVENHDNQTLYDINALKLPRNTAPEDRARVQLLGMALTAFSQGTAYFHAGIELLRSKSGDRNSYDSGDWFNRLDFSATAHHWGTGLPPQRENAAAWPLLAPLLADPALQMQPQHIRLARDGLLDLLQIRSSSRLFRLQSAAEVQRRLTMLNTGPQQNPALVVGHLNGRGLPGAVFDDVLYVLNSDKQAARLHLPTLGPLPLQLHPVHRAAGAADGRIAQQARWDATQATVEVPARSAVVFVQPAVPTGPAASKGRPGRGP